MLLVTGGNPRPPPLNDSPGIGYTVLPTPGYFAPNNHTKETHNVRPSHAIRPRHPQQEEPYPVDTAQGLPI